MPTKISDTDTDTAWDVEQSADEDKVHGKVAGTERFVLQDSSPHVTLTGDAKITGNLGVRSTPASDNSSFIKCSPTLDLAGNLEALAINPTVDINANTGRGVYAMRGVVTGKVSGNGGYATLFGCDYIALAWSDGAGAQTIGLLGGFQAGVQTIRSGGTLNITTAAAITAFGFKSVLGTSTTITDLIGVHVRGPQNDVGGGITTTTGVLIDHIAYGSNKHLIHAFRDATNTSLRLDAGNPPDAALGTEGDSQLYLAWMENGSVNLRQVRWRQQSSLGAADKVLIAA